MNKNPFSAFVILLFSLFLPLHDTIAAPEDLPTIVNAQPTASDPWYAYKTRLSKTEAQREGLYSPATLEKIPALTGRQSQHVPWSFQGVPEGPKALFSLSDIIPDKRIDPKTGKVYNIMYHGTTSDLLPIFKQGAKAIRFDLATNTVLGQGFYLTASPNEAKAYSCDRMNQRKNIDPKNPPQAMLLVVGVEDNENIKGKLSPKQQLSDDKTGAPLDPDIYFKRKTDTPASNTDNRYNQFAFFSNTAPYLKIFEIILLPKGFGRTSWVQDFDGLAVSPTKPAICTY